MTLILTFAAFLAATSFVLGIYFRIAEYDVLASEKVWERIAPAAQSIVDNDKVPDEIAAMVAAFAVMTGCGCFVNSVLVHSLKTKLGVRARVDDDADRVKEQVAALDPDVRHALANLLQDLLIFDSLHAPIFGRLCRVLNREDFARDKYRLPPSSPAVEREVIFRITTAAEPIIERKNEAKLELVPSF
ncbi:hypothetical protein [Porphyrobacter sp. CACIAM 03H1]|uniref:hypothetical protein n=1 Tax=Porphyrobacter sp. CACIAM 03H1 TaxID=2003315 RepID=UPI000B5A6FC8|nr:hypothetical protein [Porphyrobacter sp. CACIAM 03H1]ASJ90264.1 hypothetical protein CBR61_04540 [Porphyrobacter sp. CACIAM 03H1]